MKSLLSRLNYSNVMVTILAFIVLGGGAYAATQLPKNSVGSKQIRKGSIKPSDLSAKAKRVMTGATGPTGATGLQGLPAAPSGAGEVFAQSNAEAGSANCCARIRLMTMDLPAGPGSYLIGFEGVIPEPTEYPTPLYITDGTSDLEMRFNFGDSVAISAIASLSAKAEIGIDLGFQDGDQEVMTWAQGDLELFVVKLG